MKKKVLIGLVLTSGITQQAFASTGYANDAFTFTFALIAFLLLVAGLLAGIDFLKKNGRRIIHKMVVFVKKLVVALKNLFNKTTHGYFNLSHF